MARVSPPAGACESASVQAGSDGTSSSSRSAWCRETARSVLRMMSQSERGRGRSGSKQESESVHPHQKYSRSIFSTFT